jgi:hypothetical protein
MNIQEFFNEQTAMLLTGGPRAVIEHLKIRCFDDNANG